MSAERCFWCNTDPEEAAARYEGPHATWCPHFREVQRDGAKLQAAIDAALSEASQPKGGE